ncbi:DUF5934 domain-containing protein, partial [Pseudomonas sp. EL_65y_Pfl2_R96]|uniref:DUF5934 domain-containing protein n=1 Tax=Pseudomonas sp. EL_65y_Pfl2_R96 TaxID=3088699 RepID=UPI0030DC1CCD
LLDDRYLQVMGLLCAMPMTMANGLSKDLERMKRMRTLLTTTAANLAPIQGEYLGGQIPHLLLIGRRGQPFFWSPFENAAGTHNVAVFGKSRSGKSVALQELRFALRRRCEGGRDRRRPLVRALGKAAGRRLRRIHNELGLLPQSLLDDRPGSGC